MVTTWAGIPIQRFFFKFEALKLSASGIGDKRSRIREGGSDVGFTMDPLVHSPPLSFNVGMSPMTDIDTLAPGIIPMVYHLLDNNVLPLSPAWYFRTQTIALTPSLSVPFLSFLLSPRGFTHRVSGSCC